MQCWDSVRPGLDGHLIVSAFLALDHQLADRQADHIGVRHGEVRDVQLAAQTLLDDYVVCRQGLDLRPVDLGVTDLGLCDPGGLCLKVGNLRRINFRLADLCVRNLSEVGVQGVDNGLLNVCVIDVRCPDLSKSGFQLVNLTAVDIHVIQVQLAVLAQCGDLVDVDAGVLNCPCHKVIQPSDIVDVHHQIGCIDVRDIALDLIRADHGTGDHAMHVLLQRLHTGLYDLLSQRLYNVAVIISRHAPSPPSAPVCRIAH